MRFWLLALTIACPGLGGRALPPAHQTPGAERQALEHRARALRDEAMRDGTTTAVRKAEFQQLAADVRAWQARTGQDDLRVTEESVTTARRANDGGTSGDCEDCPGYQLEADRICLLMDEGECLLEDGADLTIGKIYVYTCIWIGSRAAPSVRSGGR